MEGCGSAIMHVIVEEESVAVVVFEPLPVAGTRVVVDSLSATSVVVELLELDVEAGVAQIPLSVNRNKSMNAL